MMPASSPQPSPRPLPGVLPMNVEGFTFSPPAGFRTEEQTIALRMGTGGGPAPSLIVQSKPARATATLEELAGQTFAELSQTVPGMKNASRSEFTFADGGTGVVLAYNFPTATGELRQYFVLRLHQQRLCTVTLTLPSASLTEGNARLFMSAIASISPV
jgi:hypothetical protein